MELAVVSYIKENGLEKTISDFGLKTVYHPTLPIFKINYDQIESSKQKDHPVVRNCRGLVLEKDTYKVVQKSFDRFFNLNENEDTTKFDWSNFESLKKLDGSLIMISLYRDKFLVTTRGSFAKGEFTDNGVSWENFVLNLLSNRQKEYIKFRNDLDLTFVFELTSPWNQVVKYHEDSELTLIGIFGNQSYTEYGFDLVDDYFTLPKSFKFKSQKDIETYLDYLLKEKSTDEGIVIKDVNGIRLKIKSKWYLQLHRLAGNGNIRSPKNLIPIVLAGELEEVTSYFQHVKEMGIKVEECIFKLKQDAEILLSEVGNILNQKEFALLVLKSPISSIFFNLKKTNSLTINCLHDAFSDIRYTKLFIEIISKEIGISVEGSEND